MVVFMGTISRHRWGEESVQDVNLLRLRFLQMTRFCWPQIKNVPRCKPYLKSPVLVESTISRGT